MGNIDMDRVGTRLRRGTGLSLGTERSEEMILARLANTGNRCAFVELQFATKNVL